MNLRPTLIACAQAAGRSAVLPFLNGMACGNRL